MRTRRADLSLARLARFRARAYALLASTFLYPSAERFARLRAIAAELRADGAEVAALAVYPSWAAFLAALADVPGPEAAEREYIRLFLVETTEGLALPCESAYRDGRPEASGLIAAELERAYREGGLEPAPGLAEPPDHAAVQLEFMAFLSAEEERAWRARDAAAAERLLEREHAFLDAHVASWLPAFARRLAALGAGEPYRAAATAASALAQHDRDLLRLVVSADRAVGG